MSDLDAKVLAEVAKIKAERTAPRGFMNRENLYHIPPPNGRQVVKGILTPPASVSVPWQDPGEYLKHKPTTASNVAAPAAHKPAKSEDDLDAKVLAEVAKIKAERPTATPAAKPKEDGDVSEAQWQASLKSNYARNKPYAKPGNYNTKLSPQEEQAFRQWIKQNSIPFDFQSPVTDYDMRGFWKARIGGDPAALRDPRSKHFPDKWKTPYHETFSNQSQWAAPGAPHWEGDKLVRSAKPKPTGSSLSSASMRSDLAGTTPFNILDTSAPVTRAPQPAPIHMLTSYEIANSNLFKQNVANIGANPFAAAHMGYDLLQRMAREPSAMFNLNRLMQQPKSNTAMFAPGLNASHNPVAGFAGFVLTN